MPQGDPGGNFAGTGGYSGNFGGYGGASNQAGSGGYGGTGGWGGQFGAGGYTAGLTGAGGFNANGLGNGSMYGRPGAPSAGSGWGSATTSTAARARQQHALDQWRAAGTPMHPDAALGGFGNINSPQRAVQAQRLEQIMARRAARRAKKGLDPDEQLVNEGVLPQTVTPEEETFNPWPEPGNPPLSEWGKAPNFGDFFDPNYTDPGIGTGFLSNKTYNDRIASQNWNDNLLNSNKSEGRISPGGINSWGGLTGDNQGQYGVGPPGGGGSKFRQLGGPVDPGQSYTVGENGPETLQMNAQGGGNVIPHNPMDRAAGGFQGGQPTPMNNQPLGGMDPNALRQMFQMMQQRGGFQGGQLPQTPPAQPPAPTQPPQGGGGWQQGMPMPTTPPAPPTRPAFGGGFHQGMPMQTPQPQQPPRPQGGGGFGLSGLGLPGVMGQLRQRQGFGGRI